MLVEKVESIAGALSLAFAYGKDGWQNMADHADDADQDFADRQKYCKLLWKDRTPTLNEFGAEEKEVFDGEMVLLVRSRISDPDYRHKYDTHIKGLEAIAKQFQNEFSDCDGLTVKYWKETEVSNMYDTNMDGLKVTFKIENTNV
jgi:hypothetical protein